MIVKITIGSWRFTWSMAPITNIIGVNSKLADGNHIIMWDFDATPLQKVIANLWDIQELYRLPNIYISETSKGTGFHAWCLKKVSWRMLVEILATTKDLDWNYFKYGIYRGHFTLRVSPKCGRTIKHVHTLVSRQKEDVTIHELRSWVKYETLADGRASRKVELNIFAKEKG